MSSGESEIEIIEKSSAQSSRPKNDDVCQSCNLTLHGLNAAQRENHYSEHGSGKSTRSRLKRGRPNPTSSTSPADKPTPMKFGKSSKKTEDVFWYPALGEAPPGNYSPGVLSVLKDALKKSHKKGTTQRAVLCYERTPHIIRESFDTAWGCGYRNFMIVCAALMDQQDRALYCRNLESPSPPGVGNLQSWIENAWGHGYDETGAEELDHKLEKTKKKIGTGELYVAFTSRKIPCALVDFGIEQCPKGFDTLIEWVVNYFTDKHEGDLHSRLRSAAPVAATRKMPIVMQWDGHSVTIVGYEFGKNGKYNLLVFDPSSKVDGDIRRAVGVSTNADRSSSPSKSKLHESSKSPAAKKARTNQDNQDTDEIVNIADSDNEKTKDSHPVAVESALDPDKVIKSFRLKPGHAKKSEYQLLYFAMDDLLSDQEQNDRKVVLSERVH